MKLGDQHQKQVNDHSIKNIIIQWFGLVYDFGFRKHFYDTATDFFVKLQVNNLCNVIRRMENPFLDHFPELVILDSSGYLV